MTRWLVVLGAASLITATQGNAQAAPRIADDVARVAASREIDWRLSRGPGTDRPAPLVGELLVNQHVTRNAAIGLGLANFYGKRKGSEWRVGDGTTPRARKPAVTFLLKF